MAPPIKNHIIFLLLRLLFLIKADSKCQKSYICRNFTLEFPFTDINHSKCGLFPVNCSLPHKNPLIYLREFPMDLLGKVSDNKFLIHDSVLANYFNWRSCNSFSNVTLPKSPLVSFSYSPNLTTFNCFNPSPTVVDYFKHYENKSCDILEIYYKREATVVSDDVLPGSGCTMNQMPIRSGQGFSGEVFDLFSPNFTLEWNLSEDCYECYKRGGQCLTNESNRFYCKRGNVSS
ncbi:hypothetical protein SASPL_149429 [Salvia splendens]|uniref:Wall-associated receptor kinase n=1 Tax=Salvia splendens TaxID=180675 RepID=A0A8X8WB42_SALSN|nr:hypothetical protein SASPL_149429 [Salvia splendens]